MGLRILLVANTLPPADLSGVGEQVLQLAAGLREASHEVEVLGRGPEGAAGPKLLFPLTVAAPFLRRLRTFRPHVVQVHESDGALAAFLSALLGALAEPVPRLVTLLQVSYVEEIRAVRPLVFEGRVLGRPGEVERRFRWLKAPFQVAAGCLTGWLADEVLAPSRRTAAELERDYGLSGVRVLPNVTGGLEALAAPAARRAGSEEGPFFLFVGRLRIRKGVEVLLEALRDAPGRLLVAGDGEHRRSLERRVRELGLAERVRFLGRCDRSRIGGLLDACRALVVPSIYEGMPLVVLEAMERGVPVIASAVSGIPEVVRDRVTGWLMPPEEPRLLAAALAHAWGDPREAERRGRAGRERLLAHYRPEAAARIWMELMGIERVQGGEAADR